MENHHKKISRNDLNKDLNTIVSSEGVKQENSPTLNQNPPNDAS